MPPRLGASSGICIGADAEALTRHRCIIRTEGITSPKSSKLFCQIFGPEMGVTTQYPQILVPSNTGNFHNVQAQFKQARGPFVSEVMKIQIREPLFHYLHVTFYFLSGPAQAIKCLGNPVFSTQPPYSPVNPPGSPTQHLNSPG